MAPRADAPGSAAERRFLLARVPSAARATVELAEGEAEHAQRVLRMVAGDRALGLDGEGGAWPLVVTRSERSHFDVAGAGDARREPAPGDEGASTPFVELAVALPRGAHAEELVGRAVQLGAAALRPLACRRSNAAAHTAAKPARLARVAGEALKQSGRLWKLQFEEGCAVNALPAGAQLLVLDPRGANGLSRHLAEAPIAPPWRFTRERPLVIAVGPEGGFDDEELATFATRGAVFVRLTPHVLRIETAAEAALAIVLEHAHAHALVHQRDGVT